MHRLKLDMRLSCMTAALARSRLQLPSLMVSVIDDGTAWMIPRYAARTIGFLREPQSNLHLAGVKARRKLGHLRVAPGAVLTFRLSLEPSD
jgi:hypothetical protein